MPALRHRGFYAQATAPGFADGAVRGQIETVVSVPPPGTAFVVSSVNPADGATLEAPDSVSVTLNRAPLASSVDVSQFELLASGGDASFGDGNESSVNIGNLTVDGMTITVDLSGAMLAEDTYRFSVTGDADPSLVDSTGLVLDGDGDGNPGGTFASTFTVETAMEPAPTFTEIQDEIFTVSCAVSGCHAGGSPSEGMNLSAGVAHGNIVNVQSNQDAAFDRIEPGDPDASYLVQKVEGTASSGARMPFGQPALSNELIQKLRDWVTDGAPDN